MRMFVVSERGRVGSNWFTSTLRTSGSVEYHGEVFNAKPSFHTQATFSECEGFIASKEVPGKVNIYKFFASQTPYMLELCRRSGHSIVVLRRQNMLAQFSSAQIRGQHPDFREMSFEDRRVPFSQQTFLSNYNRVRNFHTMIGELVPHARFVSYERLYKDTISLANDMGLNIDPIGSTFRKENSFDILGRYHQDDHALIRDTLDMIGHPEWVDEHTDIPQ